MTHPFNPSHYNAQIPLVCRAVPPGETRVAESRVQCVFKPGPIVVADAETWSLGNVARMRFADEDAYKPESALGDPQSYLIAEGNLPLFGAPPPGAPFFWTETLRISECIRIEVRNESPKTADFLGACFGWSIE